MALVSILLCFGNCSSDEDKSERQKTSEHYQMSEESYQRGIAEAKRGDFAQAKRKLEAALIHDDEHYPARVALSELLLRDKDYTGAIRHLERAVALDSTRVEARLHLARTYRKIGRNAEAKEILSLLVVERPGDPPACLALADILMTETPPSPKAALEQYEAVIDSVPDHIRAISGAGASYLRLGQFDKAIAAFRTVLRARPRDVYLPYLLATALHRSQRLSDAVEAYKDAIDVLSPASPLIATRKWNLRVAYRELRGDYPGDLEDKYRLSPIEALRDSPVLFSDVAHAAGVARTDRGRGCAWGDFNGDGALDLFTVGIQVSHSLFINRTGGDFVDMTAESGLMDSRGGWAALAGDYDNDSDLDLFVTRDAWEGTATNSLYRNRGDATFVDAWSDAAPVLADDSFIAAWGDYDADGYLDLYVANGVTGSGIGNQLFHNTGDGKFIDVASYARVADAGKTLGVAWGDYDNDGDLDLYTTDVAGPNNLYRNEGTGIFADVSARAGVRAPRDGAYVSIFFDADNDGDLDLFVSAMAHYEDIVRSKISGVATRNNRPHMYENRGNGTFFDRAEKKGLSRSVGAMGAGIGDIDYDGQIDLYLANGGPIMPRFEPDNLYHNKGGVFYDIAEEAAVANTGKGHGVAFADYDNDGDLDIHVGYGGHYPGDSTPNALYRNEGHSNNWLELNLERVGTRVEAIGAALTVYDGSDSLRMHVSGGHGFGSTNSAAVEIGLGSRSQIDRVRIDWSVGTDTVTETIKANQKLVFRESD